MAESVSVEHGGVTITTNTASEADLRTEMEAPAAPAAPQDGETPAQAAARARDAQGRFAKPEAAAPAPADPPPAEPEPPARRRDDTLPRHNPIARLNQALAQKAEAERRAATYEAELQRIAQMGPAPVRPAAPPLAPTPGPGEPQFEAFADQADPYTAYLQAWTRWDRAQAITAARAEWDAAQTEKSRAQSFQQRLADGRTRFPDFDAALTQADTLGLQVSAVMQEAIADSPHAADLVHYLATHPEACTQLAEESQHTPVAAATVMRRLLESQLAPRAAPSNGSGPAARATTSTAKPPITPVGSSPVSTTDEKAAFADDTSAAEHARIWNRRLRVPGSQK